MHSCDVRKIYSRNEKFNIFFDLKFTIKATQLINIIQLITTIITVPVNGVALMKKA